MRCRKNFVDLTTEELDWLAAGLNGLYSGGVVSAFADEHNDYFNIGIHRGPAFLPWHRHFLYRFEQQLRAVEARATLPYWDWTNADSQDLELEPWKTFFGGRANTGGRFDHWDLERDPEHHPGLPTLDNVIDELTSGTYVEFRRIEFLSHVPGHVLTGGTMAGGRSPADPLFYLHHGNVDRLWAIWQRNHPAATQYTNDNCTLANGNPCSRIDGTFVPLNDQMLGGATPASMLDRGPLGYHYPTDARLENRVIARGLPAMASGDPATADLDTPIVVFNAVPEGDTTRRPATFTVEGCGTVTFEISRPPDPPFLLLAPGPFVWPVGPLHTPQLRIWLLFTGGTPGSVSISSMGVIARDEFGTEIASWDTIPIMADSVTRPRVAVSMVIDESGSMLYDAGNNRTRLEVLKLAARTFVDQLYDDNGLALISFAEHAERLLPLEDAGGATSSVRQNARQEIDDHGPPDNKPHTSIGSGIQESAAMYADSPAAANYDIRATVVFTDGFEDREPLISQVRTLINERVYAIGVAEAANVRNDILRSIANETGGFMLVTGAISQDDEFLLDKFFIQVLAGVTNRAIVQDPEGWVIPGQVTRMPFRIVRSDIAFDAVALSRGAGYLAMALEAPDGQIITAADLGAGGRVVGPTAQTLRVTLPVVADGIEQWEGLWHLLLGLEFRPTGVFTTHLAMSASQGQVPALRYHGIVHARSNLQLRVTATQSSLTPGGTITIRAVLTEYGEPLETHPVVELAMRAPDGSLAMWTMAEVSTGAYEHNIIGSQEGVYRFLVSATGLSLRGSAFTRQQMATVVVGQLPPRGEYPDGRPGGDPAGSAICELIACLTSEGVLTPEAQKRAEGLGINIDQLRRCLDQLCPPQPPPVLLARRRVPR